MLARLLVLLAILAIAIPLQIAHCYIPADIFFTFCLLVIGDAIMCNFFLHSPLILKIGKAKDARLIKVSDPLVYDVLCVPISLRLRWWEAKNIQAVIESLDINITPNLYDLRGETSGDSTFTLDWQDSKKWIPIAYLDHGVMVIGTPIDHKFPGRKENYPITVKVWHSDKLMACSNYILYMNMRLLDDSLA